ncbi:MAG: hypothetical protein CM1200mP40_32570 [Gammaproteobacteria bacterium]|nr:MAG: hypothetical protein CM1200mP40_32570 [Gammaproteobacteria bacterium]
MRTVDFIVGDMTLIVFTKISQFSLDWPSILVWANRLLKVIFLLMNNISNSFQSSLISRLSFPLKLA